MEYLGLQGLSCCWICFTLFSFWKNQGIEQSFRKLILIFCHFRKVSDNSADTGSTGVTGFCNQLTVIFSTVFHLGSINILLIVALQIYTSTIAYKTDYLFTRNVFNWEQDRFIQISTVDQGTIVNLDSRDVTSKLICQFCRAWPRWFCSRFWATNSGSRTPPSACSPRSLRSLASLASAPPGSCQLILPSSF